MFSVGDRVLNASDQQTAVPKECFGTVVDGPNSSYGVTVLWDGFEFFDSYGERGWRPCWDTQELRHVDTRKHAVYDPCDYCGSCKDRVFVGIPARVLGGVWVAGADVVECSDCGKRLYYRTCK